MNTEQMNTEQITTKELNILILKQLENVVAKHRDNKYLDYHDSGANIEIMYTWYQDKQNKDLTFKLNFEEYLKTQKVYPYETKQNLIDEFIEFSNSVLSDGIDVMGYFQAITKIKHEVDSINNRAYVLFYINDVRYSLQVEIFEYYTNYDTIFCIGRVFIR